MHNYGIFPQSDMVRAIL